MGEAKRKRQQERQLSDVIRERVDTGEFGASARAEAYVVVLDKTPAGLRALAALRSPCGLWDVQALTVAEPLRVWEASPLFAYAVLCGGVGSAERRTMLAADRDRLLQQVLPRALASVQAGVGRAPGILWGTDAALTAAFVRPPPLREPRNESVAGEEDPGSGLDQFLDAMNEVPGNGSPPDPSA